MTADDFKRLDATPQGKTLRRFAVLVMHSNMCSYAGEAFDPAHVFTCSCDVAPLFGELARALLQAAEPSRRAVRG